MKKITCSRCNKTDVPLNETINVDDQPYCADCANASFPEKKDWEGRKLERISDPTICSSCQGDFNDLELNKVGSYPICPECEVKIKNRTFPVWVKLFLSGIAAIVVFAFFWNWTYYEAYNNINKLDEAIQKQDYAMASELMNSASKKVPDVKDLKIMADYFKGLDLLTRDKSEEALSLLIDCKNKLPESYHVNSLITQAAMGTSFDKKDYEGFLKASIEHLELDSTMADSWTSVASAYACIYASKGNDSAKLESLKYLNRAKSIDSTGKEAKEYYNVVEYRIDSREIISREEFAKRFPNGWTKN